MRTVEMWISLLEKLAVLLLINLGALSLFVMIISTAISVALAAKAASDGTPLHPDTLRLVSSTFNFSLGALAMFGVISGLERVVKQVYQKRDGENGKPS